MCVYSMLDQKSNVWRFDDEVDDRESSQCSFAERKEMNNILTMKIFPFKFNLREQNKCDLLEQLSHRFPNHLNW